MSKILITLTKEEKNNYGIIINSKNKNSYNYTKNDYLKGVDYIYNELVKPFQMNLSSKFNYLKNRETNIKKSRSFKFNLNNKLYNRIVKNDNDNENENEKYKLTALRMNDFDPIIYSLDLDKLIIKPELQVLIDDEIKLRNDIHIDDKNKLLLNNENKYYKYGSNLSRDIMLVFKKIYKLSISAVEIRRFYCTYLKYHVEDGHMTENQHREIAEMMNHTYEENLKYSYNII